MIDFLVIGGGIAGISTAARLSHLGKVVVLEAESALGYHASGRSAAMFEETYGSASTIALNQASRSYHETANGGVLSPRGLMLIGSDQDRAEFASDMKVMALEDMSLDEALAMVPILNLEVITQVGYHADAFDIDTNLLIQNFAREVRTNSGEIITNQRVTKCSRANSGWQVKTDQQDFNAKTLINAAGAWVDQIAQMAGITPLGFSPQRRSIARVPAPDGHDVKNWPLMFGPGENWYAKPDAGKLLISPADEAEVEPHDAWPEDLDLATGIARYEAVMNHSINRLESCWAGLRTFSKDRSLVIGPDPNVPSFFWVAGQGGYGFQSSPAASQLVSDLISGRANKLDGDTIKLLSPSRFS